MKKSNKEENNLTNKKARSSRGTNKGSKDLKIIGIGTSAGGLEALEKFFRKVSEDSGYAYVVIQHLDPKSVDYMPELLQKHSKIPIQQATRNEKVKANTAYIIPPNKEMTIENGELKLRAIKKASGLKLPIDIFFNSLAKEYSERSVGIILSGMGSDGSKGLKAIKEKNGLIIVQDPKDAKFNGMPRSAIESVSVDIIAKVEEIPALLISSSATSEEGDISITLQKHKNDVDKIVSLLHNKTGHDFSLYKKTTLYRRIDRRKTVHQIEHIKDYYSFLEKNEAEIYVLFKEFLIGVTGFFRDSDVWDHLKEETLLNLMQSADDGQQLRAWIPACSTGEEAYSLAIIFKEIADSLQKNVTLQIFATDIDEEAINVARKGRFQLSQLSDISSSRLQTYFDIDREVCLVNSNIREMIVFAPHDIIKDPPFTNIDILMCRNLLIYLETTLQEKIITLFDYCINESGILVLGNAESLGNFSKGFTESKAKLRIFTHTTKLSAHNQLDIPTAYHFSKKKQKETKRTIHKDANLQLLTNQILLDRFEPSSVLVNGSGDILYITGRTGNYLEPVAGKANWNIFAMAREGLREVLPKAFRKTRQNYSEVSIPNIKVKTNGEYSYVDISVQCLDKPEELRGMIIVYFKERAGDYKIKETPAEKPAKSTGRIHELELELKRSYEELQNSKEVMQTSEEELKSTNEELQSTNEELQSTNEELTTSKEEMQSLNEELHTVNTELTAKVNDYVKAQDDMKNLLNSIDIAILFLDKKMNIRRFTERLTNIFKIRLSDTGRPFTDLVSNLHYTDIEKDAQQVLKTLIPSEKQVKTTEDKWYSIKILPYRTTKDIIDGLVITFTDITDSKELEFELINANRILGNNKKR